MRVNIITAILIALLSITPSHSAWGNAKSNNKRPKIGLALSGGGARGLAHIGVIKALEEKITETQSKLEVCNNTLNEETCKNEYNKVCKFALNVHFFVLMWLLQTKRGRKFRISCLFYYY